FTPRTLYFAQVAPEVNSFFLYIQKIKKGNDSGLVLYCDRFRSSNEDELWTNARPLSKTFFKKMIFIYNAVNLFDFLE
ncbi:hypothetical protein LJB81_02995, partial [Desulfovibrio sp. OttesenSCG-928-M14]|nr:hypothetical protein [Desulfovibrio sp. OttesenSCG-928-M14]